MSQLTLSTSESRLLEKLSKNQYMQPIQKRIDDWVEKSGNSQSSWKKVLDNLYEISRDSQDEINSILDSRLVSGEISDKVQASRSIAGNIFSSAIIYILIQNKLVGNISEKIFIANHKSTIPDAEKMFTINIGEEVEKLDINLAIYSLKENLKVSNCIIINLCKSSIDSVEKIYKWKLLMEIAISDCEVREKYNISYKASPIPVICVATLDSHNVINNPQHRGMFKFFDRAFIGKPIDPQATDFISPLSSLIDFANENLAQSG